MAMAFKTPTPNPSSILLIFLLSVLLSTLPKQGACARDTRILHYSGPSLQSKGLKRGEGHWRWKEARNGRRRMIGSIAPTCTYNECRGCRYKCRAEQVPVDANDPVNSAYRYRCVCHR